MSKMLVVAGMHRSGTSLTASWLHANGLFLGNNLMYGGFDNIKGHFEDLEILKIHEQNLLRQGFVTNGLKLKNSDVFSFDNIALKEVKKIIELRSKNYIWGWKEPRGTLFLEDWYNLNPDMFCLAVYRDVAEVTDSLERRSFHTLFNTKNIKNPNRFIKKIIYPIIKKRDKERNIEAWIKYNNSILEFKKKHPDNCIILNLNDLMNSSNEILELLYRRIGFKHDEISFSSIFSEGLYNKNSYIIKANKKLLKMIDETTLQLIENKYK